jgi:putative tryptophan/tyrosine transport system substrate-binding protein
MLYAVKRLAPGLALIALASAILLISDRGRGGSSAEATALRVAILQHANTVVLEDGLRGTLDALAERGFRDGERLRIERFNAQGDMPTGLAIARQITGGDYDLVITSSTPSMQAVANNNREGKVRHVFTLVADPFASGIGLDRARPLSHPPHLVGQGIFPPVERAFQLARRMLPALARIGVAWNPSESNSLAFVTKAREVAKAMNLELLEANVDNTGAVTEAVGSLIARDAQAIWVGGDNTVVAAIGSVIATAQRAGIPVFSILPGAPDRGTLFDAGPDFYEVGRQGGFLVADILAGEEIARIPIRDVLDLVPPYLSVNVKALQGLEEPWRVPGDVRDDATVVVDESGVRRNDAPSGGSPVVGR